MSGVTVLLLFLKLIRSADLIESHQNSPFDNIFFHFPFLYLPESSPEIISVTPTKIIPITPFFCTC